MRFVSSSRLETDGVKALTQIPKIRKLFFEARMCIKDAFPHFIQRKGQFEALSLGSLHLVQDDALRQFIDAQPHLTFLELQNPRNLTDDTLQYLCTMLPYLQTFKITFTHQMDFQFTCSGFKDIEKLKKLETFAIDVPRRWHIDHFCKEIAKSKSIKNLACKFAFGMNATNANELCEGLPLLESFEFSTIKICNYEHFFKQQSKLKTLIIPRTSKMGDTLIHYCTDYLPKLEKLHLGRLNDRINLLPILAKIKSLQTLVLEEISPKLRADIRKLRTLRPDMSIEILSEDSSDDTFPKARPEDFSRGLNLHTSSLA